MNKQMVSAADFLPEVLTLPALKSAAAQCRGCDLYKQATQTVFGSGSANAILMIVGEIAGEKEDELGKPFVGPAGKLLRHTLEEIGANINEIYFTNAVKHFKFTYMNKRKLHRSPAVKEIKACMPWLESEIEVVQPKIILCLGAIAAKTLIDHHFKLREQRGQWFKFNHQIRVLATFHPSAILRAIDRESRHEMREVFVKDIKKVIQSAKKY